MLKWFVKRVGAILGLSLWLGSVPAEARTPTRNAYQPPLGAGAGASAFFSSFFSAASPDASPSAGAASCCCESFALFADGGQPSSPIPSTMPKPTTSVRLCMGRAKHGSQLLAKPKEPARRALSRGSFEPETARGCWEIAPPTP